MKQIVGSTLTDDASSAPVENFVASRSAAEFAELYRRDGLAGGHVIMLGPGNEEAALSALRAYPGGLQVGGGVTAANAATYLAAGASHDGFRDAPEPDPAERRGGFSTYP